MNYPISPDHPNFKWSELVDPETHQITIDGNFWRHMDLLQQLRDWWKDSISIIDPSRPNQHRPFITNIRPSLNLNFPPYAASILNPSGIAADPMDAALDSLRQKAKVIGFTGIGRYADLLHLDLRDGEPAFWDGRSLPDYDGEPAPGPA